MAFDMNQCVVGSKLVSVHGTILTYLGKNGPLAYPHRVRYPDGSEGTRTDDGYVFKTRRLPTDEDITGFAQGDDASPRDLGFRWEEGANYLFKAFNATGIGSAEYDSEGSLHLHTRGWSECEDIIEEASHSMWWTRWWYCTIRGGHYIFKK